MEGCGNKDFRLYNWRKAVSKASKFRAETEGISAFDSQAWYSRTYIDNVLLEHALRALLVASHLRAVVRYEPYRIVRKYRQYVRRARALDHLTTSQFQASCKP